MYESFSVYENNLHLAVNEPWLSMQANINLTLNSSVK